MDDREVAQLAEHQHRHEEDECWCPCLGIATRESRALARVAALEAAGRDWHEKAKTATDTTLHRMGHRDDLEAIRADNEASEAVYQAEDRLRGLFDPEWHALAPQATE